MALHDTSMGGLSSSPLIAFLIVLSIASVPFSDVNQSPDLIDESIKMEQIGGGGGSLEEQCGSITFENMFEYSRATFDIIINDDWETADVQAVAWVNNTLADELRVTMDEFMELLDPNKGGDGWFSTDEREFFRALASECIEHTLTRIGFRDGPAHRGGLGTDWKNTSWEEDGVVIEEWNIVPPLHSQIRGCTSSIGGDCNEVPVVPDSSRNCDTSVSQDLAVDECRVQLWLNATLSITGVEDPNWFTFSLNASNLSGARFDFTFPQTNDLRLEMSDECEGRDVGLNESTAGGQAPTVGGCIGDGSSTYNLVSNEDGSLTLELSPNGYREDWPMGEDLFFDFTTAPIPEPTPPAWTDDSPSNGTWFPVPNSGDVVWANWDEGVSRWFNDEDGVANLEIVCNGDDGLSFWEAGDRSLMASVPDSGTIDVTCAARDYDGLMTENRTWHIGVPFMVYSDSDILTDPHQITIDGNPGWPDLSLSIHLVQGTSSQELGGVVIDSSGPVYVQGSSSNMQPGGVDVRVLVSGEEVFTMSNTYLLGIVKESSPPLISISESIWDGSKWSMQGQYSDPDGESVSFTMRVDGTTAGSVSVSGNSWSTPLIDFSLWDSGEHTVEVEGCDDSFRCTVIYQVVNNSILFEVDEPDCEALNCGCDPSLCDDDGGGIGEILPASGLLSVILSFALGTILYRRRN